MIAKRVSPGQTAPSSPITCTIDHYSRANPRFLERGSDVKSGVRFANFTSCFLNISMKMKLFGLKGGFK